MPIYESSVWSWNALIYKNHHTCANERDGMNSNMPSSCPVASTLYGVKCRSRFSNLSNRSISDTIWTTYRKKKTIFIYAICTQIPVCKHTHGERGRFHRNTNWSWRRSSPFLNMTLQVPPFAALNVRRKGCNALLNIDDSEATIPVMRTPGVRGDRIGYKWNMSRYNYWKQ